MYPLRVPLIKNIFYINCVGMIEEAFEVRRFLKIKADGNLSMPEANSMTTIPSGGPMKTLPLPTQ